MATPIITHRKVSGKPAGSDPTRVYGTHWDDSHVVTGLENVDNTSDVNKPVSTAQAAADAVVAANSANASNLTSGTVPAARLSGTGSPLVVLITGQSFLTLSQTYTWTPAANLTVWNFNGVDGNVGTAYAAPSGSTITLAKAYASRLAKENPTRTVYAIIIGFAGQAISHWLSGASSPDVYQNILNNITAALAAAGSATQIERFVWIQGQGDTLPLNTSYVANHATMMSRFWGNSWFPKETRCDIFSIASTADSAGANADADNMNDLLQAVANADPDKRRYFYLSSLTGATYWDAGNAGHPTGQGAYSMAQLIGRNSVQSITADPASGNIAIGTAGTVSGAAFAVNAGTYPVLPTIIGGTVTQRVGTGSGTFDLLEGVANFAQYIGRRTNGSLTAKTALAIDDIITGFGAQGYDGSAYTSGNKASLLLQASEAWTSTHRGTYGAIYLTQTGTDTTAQAYKLEPGGLTINGTTSGGVKIAVPAAAGSSTLTLPTGTTDLSSAWTTYTPTVTSSAGTPTTVSATGRYKQIGKTIFLQISITVTTVGTASGVMYATLPVNANTSGNYIGTAYEHTVTGNTGAAAILGFFNAARVQTGQYNGATWWVNTYSVDISTTYEVP